MTYPQDEDSDPYKQEYYWHLEEKPKIKIGKLKRELKFLERGVQQMKTKLQKLQDHTLPPSTSTVGLWPN